VISNPQSGDDILDAMATRLPSRIYLDRKQAHAAVVASLLHDLDNGDSAGRYKGCDNRWRWIDHVL
jgi:hypothetical protein